MSAAGPAPAAGGANPLQALLSARQQLINQVFPEAPPDYRTRIFVQMGLCGLLIFQSAFYLVMAYIDAKRRGTSIRMIKLQRTAGGRLIIVQTLYVYVFFSMLSGVIMLIGRWRNYQIYFQDGSRKNTGILNVMTWTPASFSAIAYTFSNFSTTLVVMKKNKALAASGPLWVAIHNTGFIFAFVAWLATLVPLSLISTGKTNKVIDAATEILALIDGVVANPTSVTAQTMVRLKILQDTMLRLGAEIKPIGYATVGIAITFSCLYAVGGIVSLLFVLILRQQSRWNRAHDKMPTPSYSSTSKNIMVSQEQRVVVEGAGVTTDSNATPVEALGYAHAPTQPFGNVGKTTTKAQYGSQNNESIALQRLANDLTLSVPLVLLLALYFPILGGLGIRWQNHKEWPYQELRLDGFSWPELTLTNSIVGYFCWSLFWLPGRYGEQQQPSQSKSSASEREVSRNNNNNKTTREGFHIQMQPFPSGSHPLAADNANVARPAVARDTSKEAMLEAGEHESIDYNSHTEKW